MGVQVISTWNMSQTPGQIFRLSNHIHLGALSKNMNLYIEHINKLTE